MGKTINRTPTAIQSKVRKLPFQQKIKKYQINSNFFKKWNSEMAYILGFISADGNISRHGRAHMLQIASDDKDVIKKIINTLNSSSPIMERSRWNGKVSYQFRVSNKIIFNDLIKLKITERKSLTLTPPQIPKAYISHYLRGFFDGDGSVYVNKRSNSIVSEWYSASVKMANYIYKNIKHICPEFKGNVSKVLTPKKDRYYYSITLGHRDSLILFRYLYKNATIYMNRKYIKFIEGGAHNA
ncbi:MAG: LAGLIDADG family homing endonuclease [Patescibacteria group bacterium]